MNDPRPRDEKNLADKIKVWFADAKVVLFSAAKQPRFTHAKLEAFDRLLKPRYHLSQRSIQTCLNKVLATTETI